jgi:hypothetical protein
MLELSVLVGAALPVGLLSERTAPAAARCITVELIGPRPVTLSCARLGNCAPVSQWKPVQPQTHQQLIL